MNTRKITAVLLAGTMCTTFLTSCKATNTTTSATTTASTATTTEMQDKIVVSLSNDGGTFDPFAHSNWGSNIDLMSMIYEKLANLDASGNIHWVMVKNWTKVDDLTYKFEIFNDIYDSNGNQITSDDVIYSIQCLIDAGDAGALDKLDHIEKVDDYNMIWHCKTAFDSGDLTNLATPYIIDQESYEAAGKSFATKPVATGPYKLESYTPGSSVILTANEKYWMNDLSSEDKTEHQWVIEKQNFKTIECQIIKDTSSAAIALEMGEIDIADTLNIIDVDSYDSNKDIQRIDIRSIPAVTGIFNSSTSSKCSNVNLRKAICYAIDNAAVASAETVKAEATYGIGANNVGAPADWTTGRDYYNYDASKVKDYLTKAGYNGETLTLMYVSTNQYDVDAAIVIQSELKAAGITVDLQGLDRQVINTKKFDPDGGWDLRLESLSGRSDSINTLMKYFISTENASHFKNGETITMVADDKLDKLSQAVVADNSEANIDAWDDYFTFEQCYGYAICTYTSSTAARSNVVVVQGTKDRIYPNACSLSE